MLSGDSFASLKSHLFAYVHGSRASSWKSWIFLLENSRTRKVPENHFDPGKSWKLKLKVLDFFWSVKVGTLPVFVSATTVLGTALQLGPRYIMVHAVFYSVPACVVSICTERLIVQLHICHGDIFCVWLSFCSVVVFPEQILQLSSCPRVCVNQFLLLRFSMETRFTTHSECRVLVLKLVPGYFAVPTTSS